MAQRGEPSLSNVGKGVSGTHLHLIMNPFKLLTIECSVSPTIRRVNRRFVDTVLFDHECHVSEILLCDSYPRIVGRSLLISCRGGVSHTNALLALRGLCSGQISWRH